MHLLSQTVLVQGLKVKTRPKFRQIVMKLKLASKVTLLGLVTHSFIG